MKRKVLAILLAAAMTTSLAAGCAGGQKDAESERQQETAGSEAQADTETQADGADQGTKEIPDIGLDTENLDMSSPARVIVTTDGECDDQNSMRHMLLYANDLDIAGLVYSASQFHWQGDGEHTISEVIDDYMCQSDVVEVETALSFRPQEIGWIEDVIQNEYAVDYENLVKNDPDYPAPDELLSLVKMGNVEFEGDVREATEGSDWIMQCILDDDPRPLYIESWGGFNTVARALLSINEEYGETDQWQEIYDKVCGKVVIQGNGQDKTYENYIKELYPDLVIYSVSNLGYGYNASQNASEQARYMFQADWLSENIKFDHGEMMSDYHLINDGAYYEGEPDLYQFGQQTTIDWSGKGNGKEYNTYDWIGEGDSGHWISLVPVGLRGLENPNYGTWAGRILVNGQAMSGSGDYKELDYVTGQSSEFSGKRWLEALQRDWAARADWTVNGYDSTNHAPEVTAETYDITAAPGEVVILNGSASDPDGDSLDIRWWVYEDAGEYQGELSGLRVWYEDQAATKFTVPSDAQPGDYFNIIMEVSDNAEASMTRYAQVIVTVSE